MELPTPIIHLNGTGRENLTKEYEELRQALKQVEKALNHCTLHQRDYYVADPQRWEDAKAWRDAQWAHFDALMLYTTQHLVSFIP
jgi:hypothetical protein